jgi:hypothetical protein
MGGLALAAKHDPQVYTVQGRRAFLERFLLEADPGKSLPEAERERRAEALRRLYFAGLALKSSLARGRKLKTAA